MKKSAFVIIIGIAALASCTKRETAQEPETPVALTEAEAEAAAFVPGVARIKLSADCDGRETAALKQALAGFPVKSVRRLFPDAGEFEERTRREGLHLWYVVEYDESIPATKAAAHFDGLKGVEIYEQPRQIKINDNVFNDPKLSSQWGLINSSKPGADINVEPVWKNYTVGSNKVIVGVVDGGVDLTHEDLVDNCLPGGVNGSKNFTNGSYVIDPNNHGTHVAGIIAAVNNNGKGVCGIAGGDAQKGIEGVKIMSCQIFGTGDGDSAAAIKWAADHGAVVVNNSWGYVMDVDNNGTISPEELERAKGITIEPSDKAAIDYFNKYAGCDNDGNQLPDSPMKGGVVFFAAGNDNIEYGWPANYEGVIAVGSMTSSGYKSSFSNHGDWVDICAPGSSITSTVTGGYGSMSGTSMACPHATGVAALVVSYCGGPGFTADMLKEKLIQGANYSLISESAQIGPMVDVLGAITYGSSNPPSAVTSYTATPVSNSVEFSWKVTGNSNNIPATGYILYASKNSLAGLDPAHPGEDVKYAVITLNGEKIGDTMTARITDLDFQTKYYVTLAGYDYSRSFSAVSSIKTVTTLQNNPPTITTEYNGDYKVKAHETMNITYLTADPDGHPITVEFGSGCAAESWKQGAAAGSYILTVTGKDAEPGTYNTFIKATDSYGLFFNLPIQYTVLENHAPEVVKQIDNMLFTKTSSRFTLDMAEYIQDPDGETLRYSINISNRNVVTLNQQGNILYGSLMGYGLSDITLTGADAKGLTTTLTFKVLVSKGDEPFKAYPNPVVNTLNITVEEQNPVDVLVKIISSTGQTVYENTIKAGAFDPYQIDLSACPPGRYTLSMEYNGKSEQKTIIKK
ncbi:MAG: S8 family serine peptidase [Bacteroidales bacterium]|nr:S8 family serine peptidase [Bacteroidales bacterium]